MELTVQEELAAQAIGQEAMRALEGIRRILNDDALDDPECFQRIASILTALEESGIFTTRHDW